MNDCIFCKIVVGIIPSAKVYEDESVFAFLDINPTSMGHTLVVPKKHFATLMDLPDEELGKVILAVKKISAAVKKSTNAAGINVAMNNGKAAGQVVMHAHFHIIPRQSHDGLQQWPQGKYSEGEMQKTKESIAKFL